MLDNALKLVFSIYFTSLLIFQPVSSKMQGTHNCDSPNKYCSIECSDTLSGQSVTGHDLVYYSDDPNVNVSFFHMEGYYPDFTYKSNVYSIILSLGYGYSGGTYECWVQLQDISNNAFSEDSCEIKPSNTPNPIPLGEACDSDQECMTLFAQCHGTCVCPSDSVNYNNKSNSPACLPSSFSKCITTAQCQLDDDSYICVDYECTYQSNNDYDYDSSLPTYAIVLIAISGVIFVVGMGLGIYSSYKRKQFWKKHKVVGVVAAVGVIIEETDDKPTNSHK